MEKRIRSRNRSTAYGEIWNRDGTTYGPFGVQTFVQRTEDFIKKSKRPNGETPPSDLDTTSSKIVPLEISYEEWFIGAFVNSAFRNVPMGDLIVPPGSEPWDGWGSIEPDSSQLVATLLANSNPFRYTVSVPVMVAELLEATSLLKFAVKGLTGLAANYLNLKFGWLTLMQDIRTLANITTHIETRVREFNALVFNGSVSSRVPLGSYGVDLPKYKDGVYIWSTFATTIQVDVHAKFTSKIWGTCRWRPRRKDAIPVDDLERFNLAVKAVLDAAGPLSPDTVWEMIPFSWLIDYFTNIGDVLKAIERSDLVEPFDICIMRQRSVEAELKVVSPWFTQPFSGGLWDYRNRKATGGTISHVTKVRNAYLDSPTPGDLLSFGFMTKDQAVTLGALVIALARRGK